MILDQETFEGFGYYPSDLKPQSNKKILAVCDSCGKARAIPKKSYRSLCLSCSMKGKTFTAEHKRNMSEAQKGKTGEENSNWQGGISFEPYCIKFNKAYKEHIRERFERKCFLCDMTEADNCKKLDVHHVNYNKDCGCDDTMCICVPLCRSCHAKTNGNRSYWQEIIMQKLKNTLLGW